MNGEWSNRDCCYSNGQSQQSGRRRASASFERTSRSLGPFVPRFALGDLDGDGIDDIAYFDSTNGDVGLQLDVKAVVCAYIGKKNVGFGDMSTLSPFTQSTVWHYFAALAEGVGVYFPSEFSGTGGRGI
ncbi:MAG: hypothetical protein R3C28_10755 [Pirellulaceae bacterium]